MMKVRGAKDLGTQLKNIGKGAEEEIDGKASLEDLLAQDFLNRHTSYNHFEFFIESLPIQLYSQEDLDNMDRKKVDPVIKKKQNLIVGMNSHKLQQIIMLKEIRKFI